MALRVVSRVGSLMRVAPQLSAPSARGFATFDDRERGEERVHFRREEERLLRDLLSKVKKQTDAVSLEPTSLPALATFARHLKKVLLF
ncbi:hypothetical protein ABBQ38_007976 [Trebouxia sp. C0009 RCD-2024]